MKKIFLHLSLALTLLLGSVQSTQAIGLISTSQSYPGAHEFSGDIEGYETKPQNMAFSTILYFPKIDSSFIQYNLRAEFGKIKEGDTIIAGMALDLDGSSPLTIIPSPPKIPINPIYPKDLNLIFKLALNRVMVPTSYPISKPNAYLNGLDDFGYNVEVWVNTEGENWKNATEELEIKREKPTNHHTSYAYPGTMKGFKVNTFRNYDFHNNYQSEEKFQVQASNLLGLDLEALSQDQLETRAPLPTIYTYKSSNIPEKNPNTKIFVVNPSIVGTISLGSLDQAGKPLAENLVALEDIKIRLMESTPSGPIEAGSTFSDENGSFVFSNIDSNPENDYSLKDSKNQLFLELDHPDYLAWTAFNNSIEPMDATRALGRLTDIARYEFKDIEYQKDSDLEVRLMDDVTWRDGFEELDPHGERARDFKIILTQSGEGGTGNLGSLTVNYLDIRGESLANPSHYSGPLGSSYNVSPKTFQGYSLFEVQGNPQGSYSDQDQLVNFIYRPGAG